MNLHRLKFRLAQLVKYGVVLAILGGVGMFAAMEYTARPKFCSSCHNMQPYYDSWKTSSHKHVPCTDCHYEPGLLETFEGKFKALSQVAKYFTATEGTKPWAEVSDFSCMRAGCHSKRLLSGRIKFGRVNFDHRHHLTELRRGKKLRCTSCHSQVMVGSHMQVTKSTCFQCHFHKSKRSSTHEDCNTCHGPPKQVIQVAGKSFRHREYTERGVACKNCHSRITKGTGLVPRSRCRTCHNAIKHLNKYSDTEFLHTFHVSKHKVECFHCHSEIRHQLEPLPHKQQGNCSPCHTQKHSVQLQVYMGRGGKSVASQPSRMFQTRVGCDGCHACFPGTKGKGKGKGKGGGKGTGASAHFCVAKAATCIHCHGKTFDGMLGRLQSQISGDHTRLTQSLSKVQTKLKASPPADAKEKAKLEATLATATHNLELVGNDGSSGMHNPGYVRSLMASVQTRLTKMRKALKMELPPVPKVASSRRWSCTTACHAGIEKRKIGYGETRFSHTRHVLNPKLNCDNCHKNKPHGVTLKKATSCDSSCHHSAKKSACDSCHPVQGQFLRGVVADGRNQKYKADVMAKAVQCTGCHAKLSTGHRIKDVKQTCISCHEKGYEAQVDEWRTDAATAKSALGAMIGAAQSLLPVCPSPALTAELKLAKQTQALMRSSGGVHNINLTRTLAKVSQEKLVKALMATRCPTVAAPARPAPAKPAPVRRRPPLPR